MENKKINILVMYEDKIGGVGYFRSLNPHIFLGKHYSDDFEVDIVYSYPTAGDLGDFFDKYDIIQYHKILDPDSKAIDLIRKANPRAKIVCDIDDFYKLPNHHPNYYGAVVVNKVHEKVLKSLRDVDYITTTTPIFADILKKVNPNVEVLPNAIDMSDRQFHLNKTKSDRIRFGLVVGSSHLEDIKILKNAINQLSKDVLDKIQICLCGFNTEGKLTKYDQNGKPNVREILPKESVYYEMEKILTNNYTTISQQHKDFLMRFIPKVKDPFVNEPYTRHWTLPIDSYYQHYNNVDVLLVPLVESTFNACKSQLKLIEAGFAHIPVICQNFGPYTIDSIPFLEKGNTINPEGNCLLVDTVKNHKMWGRYISILAEHPEYITKMADNLAKHIQTNYSIEAVTQKRAEFYKKIVSE